MPQDDNLKTRVRNSEVALYKNMNLFVVRLCITILIMKNKIDNNNFLIMLSTELLNRKKKRSLH